MSQDATEKKPLEQMTLEEMEARRNEVEEEMAALRAKLNHAKARKNTTGNYSDPDWWRRATTRLDFNRVEHQRLNRVIAERKRALRQDHNNRVESHFIAVARDLLDPVTFDTIHAKAKAAVASIAAAAPATA
jgi:tRNA C32,U32 (ribose-2'-O)-methylase TrmJ